MIMFYTVFVLFVCLVLHNRVFAQDTLIFDDTTTTMSSGTSNGVSCSCVSMGSCATVSPGIDIRIVNTISNCSMGQVYCCSSSSLETLIDNSCGIRKIPVISRSQGQASYGAYPWQAALLTTNNAYIGSGVLVTPNHVLTVAHKIASYMNDKFKVRLGEWDGQSTTEPYSYKEYSIQKITLHPDFNSVNLENDVAVITLSGTVPISNSPHINTACFPSAIPAAGTRCWVSGWGKDAFGANGQYQSIMKEVDVPIVDQETCEVSLRQTRLGRYFVLNKNSFLCAGGEAGKDACTGDGGSPLVCETGNEQWQVIGMVAWGIGCATSNVPGIYINVYNYIPWIVQQLSQIK